MCRPACPILQNESAMEIAFVASYHRPLARSSVLYSWRRHWYVLILGFIVLNLNQILREVLYAKLQMAFPQR
jgi:hypothetical protein